MISHLLHGLGEAVDRRSPAGVLEGHLDGIADPAACA